MTPRKLAHAAEALVGAPFRLHGRDPATGLDCIGLFAAAMEQAGRPVSVPTGYALRVSNPECWIPDPGSCGLREARGRHAPGDVVMLQPGPAQLHLAIADRHGGWVHAHAGLRKVVRDTELPAGAILYRWRLTRAG